MTLRVRPTEIASLRHVNREALIIRSASGQDLYVNTMTLLHRLCFAGGLSVVLLVGCDPKESSLGDLPETESGLDSQETSDSSTTDSDETDSVESSVVGQPCEMSQTPLTVQLEEAPSEACGGGYCLYANPELPPLSACSVDGDCGGSDDQFYCDPATDLCVLNPGFVVARSMCTLRCETADDCVDADDGTTCEGGFSCEPLASLGSQCCQSVCVCNDDLDVVAADELRRSCETNTTTGCCDQEFQNPACG